MYSKNVGNLAYKMRYFRWFWHNVNANEHNINMEGFNYEKSILLSNEQHYILKCKHISHSMIIFFIKNKKVDQI